MKAYEVLWEEYDKLTDSSADKKRMKEVLGSLKKAPNKTGVDVGAGTGISTIAIKEAGYDVSGTDVSAKMLSVAYFTSGGEIPFYKQSAEGLTGFKNLGFVTAVNDVVNYLTPEKATKFFGKAYRSLANGGVLVFDVSSPYKYENVLDKNVFCDASEDVSYIWFNTLKDGKMTMDLTFFKLEDDGSYIREDERHVQYVHQKDFLENSLEAAGFKVVSVKEIENGERFIFTVKKP